METNKASCPKSVLELVERFTANKSHYKGQSYKEANVRQEFIDPFFTALGWDMNNTQGYAETYNDVVHEVILKIKGRP